MLGRRSTWTLLAAAVLAAPAQAAEGVFDPLTGALADPLHRVPGARPMVEFAWPQLPAPEPAPLPPLAAPPPDLTAPVVAAPGPSLLSRQAASDRSTRAAFQRRQDYLRQQHQKAVADPRGN